MAMDGARIDYRIGPVGRVSAKTWLDVTRRNIDRLVVAGGRAPFRIPDDVADQLRHVLDTWSDALERTPSDPFVYEGSESVLVARRLLTYWLNVVSLSESQRTRLGVEVWPPEAAPFEAALGRAILASLGADERLRRIWQTRAAAATSTDERSAPLDVAPDHR